jgi:hypothetical protein
MAKKPRAFQNPYEHHDKLAGFAWDVLKSNQANDIDAAEKALWNLITAAKETLKAWGLNASGK